MDSDRASIRIRIRQLCSGMKPGQRLDVSEQDFRDAFHGGFFASAQHDPIDRFLDGMIGSSWGTWRVRFNFEKRVYVISRHKEGDKMVYVSPDRRDLYRQLPDKSYEPLHWNTA